MIRIVCDDGVGHNTKVLNAETGEDISRLIAISYGATITIDQMVTGRFEVDLMRADITVGKVEWLTKHPISGGYAPLSALEFPDGTRVEFAEDGTPSVKAK